MGKHKMKKHWISLGFSAIILTLLFIQGIPIRSKCSLLDASVMVIEERICEMQFAEERRYFTNQTAHKISLEAHGLANGEHNLTLVWESDESILSFYPSEVANHTIGNVHTASFLFNGTDLSEIIFLNNSNAIETALVMTTLPSDVEILPVDTENYLDLDLLLNASEPLSYVNVEMGSSGAADIVTCTFRTELNTTYDRLWYGRAEIGLADVPPGLHHVYVKVKVSNLAGQFPISFDCYQSRNITFPTKVVLDGDEIEFDQKVRYYERGNVSYLHALAQWLYGYCEPVTYNLTFLSDRHLKFRIDPLSREKIEFLEINGSVTDFNVNKCNVEGYDAYLVDITLDSPSNVSLGITIYAKKWYLRQDVINTENIPEDISRNYAIAKPNVDSDNDFVKLWNNQVVGNESNPLLIASLVYQNLTRTLDYDENYSNPTPTNETASATLHNRAGVCRHFARAFAALVTVSHLPVRLVIGTAFNLEADVTTLKKNHTWNEIYLPVFGWVPVDVTWKQFGIFPNTHSIIAYWEYEANVLNISRTQEFDKVLENSTQLLEQIVAICRNDAQTNASLESNNQVSLLFDEATILAEQGMTHDTLLKLSEAYEIMALSTQGGMQWPFIALGVSIAIVLTAFHFVVLKRRGLKRDNGHSR
jgi:hypothetical protein